MKRCPQCEFIYEDDQSLCDMDGALLVLDSRTLPTTKTTQKRNRAVPAFATLILALVLGLVYYVSIQRRAAQNSYTPPPPSSAAAPSNPAPVIAEEPKPEPPKTVAAPAPVKKVAPKPAPTPAKQKPEEKKDDSKVNSILKKTGHILKKPFKF
jgi:hypothetical protein